MSEIISRAEAKAAGMKRYFTGLACRHGHVAERQVDSCICLECNRQRVEAHRASNPDRDVVIQAEYHSAYWAANKEKIKASDAAYRAANKEKIKARNAAYYAAKRAAEVAK